MTLPTPQPISLFPEWVTPVLAIWGAFLSSVALGWNLYRDLHDRPKLEVSVRVRRIVQSTNGQWYAVNHDLPVADASEQLYVVMSAVNLRKRPVVWVGWGGNYRQPVNGKTSFTIIGAHLPKKLDEGESHSELTMLGAGLEPANENVKRLFLWDSTARNWKLPWRKMRALRREARSATGDT